MRTVDLTLHGVGEHGEASRVVDLHVVKADAERMILSVPDRLHRQRNRRGELETIRTRLECRLIPVGTRVTVHARDVDLEGRVVRGYGQRFSIRLEGADARPEAAPQEAPA